MTESALHCCSVADTTCVVTSELPEVKGSHIINYKLKARVYANILGALLSWVMDLTHLTPGLINLLQRPITTSFKFVLFPSQFWEF